MTGESAVFFYLCENTFPVMCFFVSSHRVKNLVEQRLANKVFSAQNQTLVYVVIGDLSRLLLCSTLVVCLISRDSGAGRAKRPKF